MSAPRRSSGGLLIAIGIGLVIGLPACGGDDPRDLRWQIGFAPGVPADRARGFEATILRGGCNGSDEAYRTQARAGQPFPSQPPILESGTYGFAARAMDVDCQWYAAGCTVQELPASAGTTVVVRLDALPGDEPACAGSQRCADGQCLGLDQDAGTQPDAGLDAAVGVDAAVDLDATVGVDATVGTDAGVDAGGCPAGWDDCNRLPGDGCEQPLHTLSNCGACNTPCALNHASESCATGTCEIVDCELNWDDCDGDPTNGCEACEGNCGAGPCDIPWAVETCNAGSCVFVSCEARHADCVGGLSDGCETNVWEDERNCGDCDIVCGGGTECHKSNCE